MRTATLGLSWVWFLVALTAFSDVAVEPLLGLGLFLSVPILPTVWLAYSFKKPVVFSEAGWRWVWLSAPLAWYLPIVLMLTGWGFEARLALSEPYLEEFAEAVREGRAEIRYGAARRVGLFCVIDARKGKNDGEVILITGHGFLDRYGLAYRPGEPPDTFGSYNHLHGPWYLFTEGS